MASRSAFRGAARSLLPLKQYLDRYDPRSIPVPKSFADTFAGKPGLHRRESETWGAVTEDDVRQSRAHYYAYTEQLDAQIGRILEALDETGQADRHAGGIHRRSRRHGGRASHVAQGLASLRGVLSRADDCALAGEDAGRVEDLAPGADARSGAHLRRRGGRAGNAVRRRHGVAAAFRNPGSAPWRDDILCAYYGGEFLYTQRIAITDRFKYVFNGFDIDEMYDLERDPDEMRNVVNEAEYGKWTADMRARLYEMMARFHDPYGDVAREIRLGNQRRSLLRAALSAARAAGVGYFRCCWRKRAVASYVVFQLRCSRKS